MRTGRPPPSSPDATWWALTRAVARAPTRRGLSALHTPLFGRSFMGRHARRLLVLFEPGRITYASVYPFLAYHAAFADRFDVEIRLLPTARALRTGLPRGLAQPTHVIAQTWLTDPPERHAALSRLFETLPEACVRAYLDCFANTDIRLSAALPGIDLYFRKALFHDLQAFRGPTYGHTNLSEYYGRLYDLPDEMTDWQVPQAALGKLRLAPHFLTDPRLLDAFLWRDTAPGPEGREIDLHARLGGTQATGWYGAMRRHAVGAVDGLRGLRIASGAGLPNRAYMAELSRSKICFSPFGYGEMCWRDIEAMATGAVLLKPDMSHLRTEPDLYREGETYVACRWDFADVAEKASALRADADRRHRIATTAWQVAHAYLSSAGPVGTYAALFHPAPARADPAATGR